MSAQSTGDKHQLGNSTEFDKFFSSAESLASPTTTLKMLDDNQVFNADGTYNNVKYPTSDQSEYAGKYNTNIGRMQTSLRDFGILPDNIELSELAFGNKKYDLTFRDLVVFLSVITTMKHIFYGCRR